MELKYIDSNKKIELADNVFACDFKEPLVHQIVTAYLAGARAGTKAQKTRAEVRGGGIKPWRQKGTGRARAGTIRSPIWRKGGVVFAAKPRSYEQKVNKKMFKGAIRSIFSELIRQDRLVVISSLELSSPKTKGLLQKLAEFNLGDDVLIISDSVSDNLYFAARNLPYVGVIDVTASASNPVALVSAAKVLITDAALKEIEGLLK